jgi:hypothetical protein
VKNLLLPDIDSVVSLILVSYVDEICIAWYELLLRNYLRNVRQSARANKIQSTRMTVEAVAF